MRIEIDQSNKIEQTNKTTIIAYSNGISKSIAVSSKDKKLILNHFRSNSQIKLFVILTFCALIYLLVKKVSQDVEIYIDREYTGFDNFIKQKLSELSAGKIDKSRIHITQVGKLSNAHKKALDSMRKRKYDLKVTAKEIIKLVGTKKSGSA